MSAAVRSRSTGGGFGRPGPSPSGYDLRVVEEEEEVLVATTRDGDEDDADAVFLGLDDEAYDPSAELASLAAAGALSAPGKAKRRAPTRGDSNLGSVLGGLYGDDEAAAEDALRRVDTSDYRFVRDERYEVAPKARAGVFSAEERALSRDRRAIVGATLKLPVRAETRPPPRLDLGERDTIAWVPHVVPGVRGGAHVAWYPSETLNAEEHRAMARKHAGEAVARPEPVDAGGATALEGHSDAIARVERVNAIAGRSRGVCPVGRRFPPGGVKAKRAIPHDPPHLRRGADGVPSSEAVVRRVVFDDNGELVETAAETEVEETRETTAETETTSKRVVMDARGDVVDESEATETRERLDVDAEVSAFARLDLSDAQFEKLRATLADEHGVEASREELEDLVRRAITAKRYRGVKTKETPLDADEEDADDAASVRTTASEIAREDAAGLVGKILTGLWVEHVGSRDDRKGASKGGRGVPGSAPASANVTRRSGDPPRGLTNEAHFERHAGAPTPRSSAPRAATRGAWRNAPSPLDPGRSADDKRPEVCSIGVGAEARREIIARELETSEARTARLRAMSAKQRWSFAGAAAGFASTLLGAAKVAKEYRDLEEEATRPKPPPPPVAQEVNVQIKQRSKIVDKYGNVVERGEEFSRDFSGVTAEEAQKQMKAAADKAAKDAIASERRKCLCYKAETGTPVVSGGTGFGVLSGGFMGGGGFGGRGRNKGPKKPALGKAVTYCPVHYPFAAVAARKGNPRVAPRKTHAIGGAKGSGGNATSAREDDAGYALYETEAFYYLVSHDHTKTRWRLAKISRGAQRLEVDEHEREYTRDELKSLLHQAREGNAQTGGLEMVTRGSGVVAFLELSSRAASDEDPAGAGASGPEAVIKRAEALHKRRVEEARRRAKEANDPRLESAEGAFAGGRQQTGKTAARVVYSGVAAQVVRREGRTRKGEPIEHVPQFKPKLWMKPTGASGEVGGGGDKEEKKEKPEPRTSEEETSRIVARDLMLDSVRGELGTFVGDAVLPKAHEVETLDPGEEIAIGGVHIRRLTVGHATSDEPAERLRLGRAAFLRRKRKEKREKERAEAEARREEEEAFAANATSLQRFQRGCVDGWTSFVVRVCGADAFEDDEAFFVERQKAIRDRSKPTLAELREANLLDEHMKLLEQEEAALEDGPMTAMADWIGEQAYALIDADEEAHRIDPDRPEKERKKDPMLVKLRFRKYDAHAKTNE